MGCPGCEVVPSLASQSGTLYLAPPLAHTRARLRKALDAAGLLAEESSPAESVLAVPVPAGGLAERLGQLDHMLSGPEQQACASLFLAQGEAFDLGCLARMEPLAVGIGRAQGEWLAEMIRHERFAVHFHPIVHAQQTGVAFAQEALLRGLDAGGELVPPDRLFGAARSANLLFHLDRSARVAAIRAGRQHGLTTPLFINFNPTAIYDPSFCLRTTWDEIRQSGASPDQFVFEVVESDHVNDPDHLLAILERYRENGFRVALDDLGAGYASLTLLQRMAPDFVKIDRGLIAHVDQDPARQSILEHVVAIAGDLGIEVIAEGVEREAETRWLQDVGVDYLQGFYFAQPAPTPLLG
ncbi:EAL domain-containing protein [Spiribacter halobius]|uniref:EAL domain-containing protein n=1 Tax=Sediminicurvatus halobius TaxID=2182432 RepID=A0A2U2N4H3_9GAMM|nr:EAL domain-containing protein [Spiribacter halobius]PWG63938.1 EAL domain-containing protein [Spiribacter halobius]UEX76353.1 EAL domain-containing protein [Spiribacter halobius]